MHGTLTPMYNQAFSIRCTRHRNARQLSVARELSVHMAYTRSVIVG